MLKPSSKYWLTFIALLVFVMFSPVEKTFAIDQSSKYEPDIKYISFYGDKNYDISRYHVDVDVSIHNVLEVIEKLTVDFHKKRHGIYRDIPLVNKITRIIHNHKVTKTYIVDISNISVTDESGKELDYQKSREDDNLRLKIGSSDKRINGKHNYIIKYSYDIGADRIKEFDDIYYDIIGYKWGTTIRNITFRFHLPKAFDKDNIRLTADYSLPQYNTEKNKIPVSYRVSGNTIWGKVDTAFLMPSMGVTLKMKLPEGYFKFVGKKIDRGLILSCLIFSLISIMLFLLYGRNRRLVTLQNSSAPEDIGPAEAGYLLDKRMKPRHIIGVMLDLANRGYIRINNDAEDKFELIKLKNSDDTMRPYEKFLFDKLFQDRESVNAEQLKNNFYSTVSSVNWKVQSTFKEPSRRLYTRSGNTAQLLSFILASLGMGIMTGVAYGKYCFALSSGIIMGIMIFLLTVIFAAMMGYSVQIAQTGSKKPFVIINITYVSILVLAYLITTSYTGMKYEALAGVFCGAVCAYAGSYSKKRTEQYNLWLEKLIGFKSFLQGNQKEELKELFEINSNLAYDNLSYAYSFGIPNKWMNSFENIIMSPPSWLTGDQNIMNTSFYFTQLIYHNLSSFESNMTSSPSDSSSSGGGDSGGSGGGGGGSW